MSFDRIAVKKPEDLIPDDELEDSSLKGNKKYACDNFKDPTEIKCLDGRIRRHVETEEIFDDLFEDDDYDYHIKDSWNYLIRPAFLCEGIDPPKNMDNSGRCRGYIDDSCLEIIKEIHPENYEYSKQEIENFKQIQTSYYHPPSLLDTTRRKLFNRFYAGDSTDGYYFSDLIFSKPIRVPINHIIRFWHKSTFENSIFLNYVYFGNSYSTGAINFSNTYFFDHVCMDNTILLGAKFENAIFFNVVLWTYSIFKNVKFKNTIFYKKVHFANDGKSFFSGTDFSNATFHKEIYFNHCKFDNVSFEETIFKKEAYFEGSNFKSDNNFKYCTFQENAWFNLITYSQTIDFSNSKFEDKLYLHGSRALEEKAELNLNAITAKDIYFSSSEKEDTKLTKTNIVNINNSDIKGTIFAENFAENFYNLNNTKIELLSLSPTRIDFLKEIPDIRTLNLGTPLRFNKKDFHNFNTITKKITKKNALDSAERWEALQHHCGQHGQYRNELEFFALAMDARQLAEEESPVKRWIAKRYKCFSDYGRSIAVPFLLLILTFLAFGLIYQMKFVNSTSQSLILSAKNTFPFLPDDVFSRKYFTDDIYKHYIR